MEFRSLVRESRMRRSLSSNVQSSVILSVVDGARSAAATESKDPADAGTTRNAERHSHGGCAENSLNRRRGNRQARGSSTALPSLCDGNSAQNDRFCGGWN